MGILDTDIDSFPGFCQDIFGEGAVNAISSPLVSVRFLPC